MASNPVFNSSPISNADSLTEILRTVTGAAQFVEQLLAASGVEGAQAPEIQSLTTAFSNLAAVAIQAVHMTAGKEITPESVMSLLPVNTPLAAATGKE